MDKFIPLSVPNLSGNEEKYVLDAVRGNWVSTSGAYVTRFERDIAGYVKIENAVACQSGTAALHLSLICLGIKSNDEVIVPALTFIAAVNPVKYVGATPVFMDCDDSLCIDPEKLKAFCKNECEIKDGVLVNKKTGASVTAVIIVHVFGNMADMETIMDIAQEYNLVVIEDATEAIGTYFTAGRYAGRYAGTIGHMGAYSFNGNKIITTGGGGMVISSNQELLKRARHLSTQAKTDEVYYTHDEAGFNYRMTNVQAALGVAQLEQLEFFIDIKTRNYNAYKKQLQHIEGLSLLSFNRNARSNYWFYSLLLDETSRYNRDSLISFFKENNVQTRPVWGLIHEQKPYKECQFYRIEKALYYYERIVNIPCSTNLTEDDIVYIAGLLQKF